MTAGDRPTFYPGFANDTMALNDLSRRVGQLEAMRAAPPLRIDTTPAGNVITLGETTDSGGSPTIYDVSSAFTYDYGATSGFGSIAVPDMILSLPAGVYSCTFYANCLIYSFVAGMPMTGNVIVNFGFVIPAPTMYASASPTIMSQTLFPPSAAYANVPPPTVVQDCIYPFFLRVDTATTISVASFGTNWPSSASYRILAPRLTAVKL